MQQQQKQQSAFSFLGRSAGTGRNPLVLASHVPDGGRQGWQDEDPDALVGGNHGPSNAQTVCLQW